MNYSPEKYNLIYKDSEKYKCHYSESVYYPVWLKALDYIKGSVLEIGCGTGQFAHLLKDKLDPVYVGIDYSKEAIRIAKEVNQDMTFYCQDVIKFEGIRNYNTVIAFEVLEHIKNDLSLVQRIGNQRFIFSVPDYMNENHFRCFKNKIEIKKYYKGLKIHEIQEFKFTKNKFNDFNKIFLVYAG